MCADISSPATPGAQRMMAPAVARLAGVASSARDRSRAAVPAASGWGSIVRPAQQPPLGEGDAAPLQPVQLLGAFHAFRDERRPQAVGDAAQRLHDSGLHRVGVAVVGERPVELHDVGLQRRELAQSGVAGSHVVQSDPGSALPQTEQGRSSGATLAGVDVLGELDDDIVQWCGVVEHLLERRGVQQVRAHVHRQEDPVRNDGAAAERGPHCERLQLGPLTRGVRDGEPLVRRRR